VDVRTYGRTDGRPEFQSTRSSPRRWPKNQTTWKSDIGNATARTTRRLQLWHFQKCYGKVVICRTVSAENKRDARAVGDFCLLALNDCERKSKWTISETGPPDTLPWHLLGFYTVCCTIFTSVASPTCEERGDAVNQSFLLDAMTTDDDDDCTMTWITGRRLCFGAVHPRRSRHSFATAILVAVWPSRINGAGRVNEVTPRRARLVLGRVTVVHTQCRYVTSQPLGPQLFRTFQTIFIFDEKTAI